MKQEDYVKMIQKDHDTKVAQVNALKNEIKVLKRVLAKGQGRPS